VHYLLELLANQLINIITNDISSANFYNYLKHIFTTEFYHREQMDKLGYETHSEKNCINQSTTTIEHVSLKSTRIVVQLRQKSIETTLHFTDSLSLNALIELKHNISQI